MCTYFGVNPVSRIYLWIHLQILVFWYMVSQESPPALFLHCELIFTTLDVQHSALYQLHIESHMPLACQPDPYCYYSHWHFSKSFLENWIQSVILVRCISKWQCMLKIHNPFDNKPMSFLMETKMTQLTSHIYQCNCLYMLVKNANKLIPVSKLSLSDH